MQNRERFLFRNRKSVKETEERNGMKKQDELIETVITKESLTQALESVGIGRNMILEAHVSLSSLGYVAGGARTIVDAIMDLITDGGTLLMATQTADNTDPSEWVNPPVLPSLWQEIRDSMPAYNPENTDLCYMGKVAENFRHRRNVIYSNHPAVSFAAWGRYAKLLCNRQSMHFPLAEESPAARMYELKGYVLLIGTDLSTATCLHLAEYRTECRPIIIRSSCTLVDGRRNWKRYLDLDIDSSDFEKIRAQLTKKNLIREIMLNTSCRIQVFPVSAAVDEATRYFEKNAIYDLYR